MVNTSGWGVTSGRPSPQPSPRVATPPAPSRLGGRPQCVLRDWARGLACCHHAGGVIGSRRTQTRAGKAGDHATSTVLSVRGPGGAGEGAGREARPFRAPPSPMVRRSGRRKRKLLRKQLDARLPSSSGCQPGRGRREKMPLWELWFFLLALFLAWLTPPGNGNEGSMAGSCPCNRRISSHSPPTDHDMRHLRKYLNHYQHCTSYVRFQLPRGSVCGGSSDQWVLKLMGCFDRGECGRAHARTVAHQQHLAPQNTRVPELPERAPPDSSTPAQTNLPSTLQPTQKPTLPEGMPSLAKKLIPTSETDTSTVGHSLGAKSEARENQEQLGKNVGATAGTSALVPVLSLLVIIFLLTGVLLYVMCKKRQEQSRQYPPDPQLHYVPVASNINT
uniref:C-X-C motif chemokine 16 n=1 Tax=Sus scrofa TaxID=9823 RepID=A0A8D1YU52_PIG